MRLTRLKWVAVALAAGLIGSGPGWLRRPHHAAQAAPAPADGEPELQGTWSGVVAEIGGNPSRPSPDMPAPTARLRVEGDRLTLRGPIYGSVIAFGSPVDTQFTYRADATKTPATIDLTALPQFDDAAPTVHLAIYRRDGDDLAVCLSLPNKKRPAQFATEPKTAQMLLKLRRDEPARWEELPKQTVLPREPAPVEPPHEAVEVEPALAKAVRGKVIRATEVSRDQMILSYFPVWAFGRVDNIGVSDVNGGVRTLIDWPAEAFADAMPDRRFLLALYSRETTAGDRVTSILATEIESDWSEATSWTTQPKYAAEPAATFPFIPGAGWKLFDVTELVRRLAREGRTGLGIVLRFRAEDRLGSRKDWSGYDMVSREGAGEWKSKRPKLLVVEPAGLK